jgi:hypothetical protein
MNNKMLPNSLKIIYSMNDIQSVDSMNKSIHYELYFVFLSEAFLTVSSSKYKKRIQCTRTSKYVQQLFNHLPQI